MVYEGQETVFMVPASEAVAAIVDPALLPADAISIWVDKVQNIRLVDGLHGVGEKRIGHGVIDEQALQAAQHHKRLMM